MKSELESLQEKETYALPLKQNNSKQEHKQCILGEMLAMKKNTCLCFTECQISRCSHLEEQQQISLINMDIWIVVLLPIDDSPCNFSTSREQCTLRNVHTCKFLLMHISFKTKFEHEPFECFILRRERRSLS